VAQLLRHGAHRAAAGELEQEAEALWVHRYNLFEKLERYLSQLNVD